MERVLIALAISLPSLVAGAQLGTAWYPEQFSEDAWEIDLQLMAGAHVEVVRVGEFAWSSMEPSEGKYDFKWLDDAIAAAERYNISVVLGTPTCAPPVWLTSKYPDTLLVREDGVREEHGNRQHFSFASKKYRELGYKIAAKMAERYGDNSNVVGWQLDNEYAYDSFDDEAKKQFHDWLEEKYGSIDELNDRWSTAYWSQTYQTFDQIPVKANGQNPALLLDWKRFASDTWRDYSINQIEAIRKYTKSQWITTNTMGWHDGFNEYIVNDVLDLVSWDDYVAGGSDTYDWVDNAARHDLTRGFKNQNFWVMETAPGFTNWQSVNCVLRRGIVRNMAWQAVGHGADAVVYWQWRSAPNGHEVYHGTLVGADGRPNPMYQEIKQIGSEFVKHAKHLEGTEPKAKVAVINDYDSRWAINFQRHSAGFDPNDELKAFYRSLRQKLQVVDVISVFSPLEKYEIVVAPSLNVLTEEQAQMLEEYVRNGGRLILGPRTGMKNYDNGLNTQRQPGPLIDLVGARVEMYYALANDVPIEKGGNARVWAEQLNVTASDAKVLLRYGSYDGWLDGHAAVSSRKVGKGEVIYVGAWLDEGLMDELLGHFVSDLDSDIPSDVEVCIREGDGKKVYIVINHSSDTRSVPIPGVGRKDIDGYDVQIYHVKDKDASEAEQPKKLTSSEVYATQGPSEERLLVQIVD